MAGDGVGNEGFRVAAQRLDIERRAWVVGIARYLEAPSDLTIGAQELREILDSAYASGEFPVGAGGYVCHEVSIEVLPSHSQATLRASADDGSDFIEYQVGFAPNAYLGVAMTRSGHFPGFAKAPGHVLLPDVEGVVLDLAVLLDHAGRVLELGGPTHFAVEILSEIRGHPLRLRCLDVETGELCLARPGDEPEEFQPVSVRLYREMDVDAGHRLMYRALSEVASQFGVAAPQLLPDPDRVRISYDRAGVAPRADETTQG